MSKVFLEYSHYYDLLYKDKNYEEEANFVIGLIKKFHPHAKTILNLGCGTGQHDQYFAIEGFNVVGIDQSEQMIAIARSKNKMPNCTFLKGDAREFKFNTKFDVVISLFHVFSYQTSNEDVQNILNTISSNLEIDGLAIFDYWYGPAVLSIKPEDRTKIFESENLKINRYAHTDLDYNKNIATVNFSFDILNKSDSAKSHLEEKHPMRYFFRPELDLLINFSKLKHVHQAEWMTLDNPPSEKSWSVYSVIKK